MNPRDERGWRIPREGTKSYHIYHLLIEGFNAGEICRLYHQDHSSSSIRVLVHNIKHPTSHNKNSNKWIRNNPVAFNAIVERSENKKKVKLGGKSSHYSLHTRKLVKRLKISYIEAMELERKEIKLRKISKEFEERKK